MDNYAHYGGWSSAVDEFLTPVTSFTGSIRQASGSGTDSFGCTQNQYTFGTIEVTSSDVNPSYKYFYSIWVPLAGVGGTLTNMTIDIGTASCSFNLGDDLLPDSTLATTNVTVTSGAAIPAGTYRIFWLGSFAELPSSTPLTSTLYFKGDTKS